MYKGRLRVANFKTKKLCFFQKEPFLQSTQKNETQSWNITRQSLMLEISPFRSRLFKNQLYNACVCTFLLLLFEKYVFHCKLTNAVVVKSAVYVRSWLFQFLLCKKYNCSKSRLLKVFLRSRFVVGFFRTLSSILPQLGILLSPKLVPRVPTG